MLKELMIDTGYLIALLSKTDQFHKQAMQLRPSIEHRKWVTTWPVLTEACQILASRGVNFAITQLLSMHENGGFELFPLSRAQIPQMISMFEKYRNLPIDFADVSLIILAEELGHGDIVSTDSRDFATYRWSSKKPFNNLFEAQKRKR